MLRMIRLNEPCFQTSQNGADIRFEEATYYTITKARFPCITVSKVIGLYATGKHTGEREYDDLTIHNDLFYVFYGNRTLRPPQDIIA